MVCAWVVLTVVLHRPLPSELPDVAPKVLPVPEAVRVSAWSAMGLPWASPVKTVTVAIETPSAVTTLGLRARVDPAALRGPATKVTLATSVTLPCCA